MAFVKRRRGRLSDPLTQNCEIRSARSFNGTASFRGHLPHPLTARHGTARHGTARHGTARHGTDRACVGA